MALETVRRKREAQTEIDIIERTVAGRRVWIVDHVLDPEVLRVVSDDVASLPFVRLGTDRRDRSEYKHFAHHYTAEDRQTHPLLVHLSDVVRACLDNVPVGELWSAHISLIPYGDVQFDHVDEDCWTCVTFLHPEWHDDWAGELFLRDSDPSISLALRPTPARMVIFDGLIRHRGGVPSKVAVGPRLALALKFWR